MVNGHEPLRPVDGASRLLAGIGWLVPAGHRDWHAAMLAEVAQVRPGPERWWFILGCAWVGLTRPAALAAFGYLALVAGVVAGAVTVSAGMPYRPLHIGVLVMVGVLVAVSLLGRSGPLLGPVADHPAARAVRLLGYVLTGGVGLIPFLQFVHVTDARPDLAGTGVPVFTTVTGLFLLAFIAVTARRSPAEPRTLTVAATAGLLAGVVWVVPVMLAPPLPADAGWGLLLVAAATAATTLIVNRRRRPSPVQNTIAGLLTAVTAGAAVWTELHLVTAFGPDRWIPNIVPQALSPADRIRESRIELADPYVVVLFLGALLALALVVTAVAAGPHARRLALADPELIGAASSDTAGSGTRVRR